MAGSRPAGVGNPGVGIEGIRRRLGGIGCCCSSLGRGLGTGWVGEEGRDPRLGGRAPGKMAVRIPVVC